MCHVQTSIQTEGFRSLAEGEPVEYFLEAGDDGRTKAVQVTGPNGAPPQVCSFETCVDFRCPIYICHFELSLMLTTLSTVCSTLCHAVAASAVYEHYFIEDSLAF